MKRIYIGVFVVITLMLFCSCQMIPSDTISTTSYQTTLETTITLETTTQPANSKIQQRFEVIQEFDAEHNAVKITVLSNDKCRVSNNIKGEYIENYQYDIVELPSGDKVPVCLNMDSPIHIYIPAKVYIAYANNNESEYFQIYGNESSVIVKFDFDILSCYSDAPMEMQDDYFHKALTEYFGGAYSKRDLLQIDALAIRYTDEKNLASRPASDTRPLCSIVMIDYGVKEYIFTDFGEEPPTIISEELLSDLYHFFELDNLHIIDGAYQERHLQYEEIIHDLKPYEVTENTWSEP